MKILVANKYFYTKGRADNSFFQTAKLLERKGHKVSFFSMKDEKNFFLIMCFVLIALGLRVCSQNNLIIKKYHKFLFHGFIAAIVTISLMPLFGNFYGSHLSRSRFCFSETLHQYTQNNRLNYKYQLYQRVFKDMLFNEGVLTWLAGIGPGTFNSRASNSRAHDTLYKKVDSLAHQFIPPHSSEFTERYLADLWTKDIATTARNRFSLLSYPFAGIASVEAELGLLGLFIFLIFCSVVVYYLLNRILSDENVAVNFILASWWVFLVLMMVLDNIQEMPQYVFPLYMLTAVSLFMKGQPDHLAGAEQR